MPGFFFFILPSSPPPSPSFLPPSFNSQPCHPLNYHAQQEEIVYDHFEYADMDTLENEINEFFAMNERQGFYDAHNYFKEQFPNGQSITSSTYSIFLFFFSWPSSLKTEIWRIKSLNEKKSFVESLLHKLEKVNQSLQKTVKSYFIPGQCLLYVMQGFFFPFFLFLFLFLFLFFCCLDFELISFHC